MLKHSLKLCVFAVAFLSVDASAPLFAQLIGPFDDFEDGTTNNWIHGVEAQFNEYFPENVSSGGPTGIDDSYLRLTSSGFQGVGGRLLALNREQWTGDYLAAGVTTITADVRNPSGFPLNLRVSLSGSGTHFVSQAAIEVPALSDWTSVEFPINETSLEGLGFSDYSTVMSDVVELRVLHNTEIDRRGAEIEGEFHLDNLRVWPFADFNLDGVVDSADLAQWEEDFGGPGSDADGDGDSDGADFVVWQKQVSAAGGLLASVQSVPEPATIGLGLIVAAYGLLRRSSR